jgi:hypothetical protein
MKLKLLLCITAIAIVTTAIVAKINNFIPWLFIFNSLKTKNIRYSRNVQEENQNIISNVALTR